VLESGGFDSEVAADQSQANAIGIQGVPFFVLDGKYAVSGAQPVEAFRKALDTAWGAGRE
jgi:predicted DsbA family dithiol-disulfide isomerase